MADPPLNCIPAGGGHGGPTIDGQREPNSPEEEGDTSEAQHGDARLHVRLDRGWRTLPRLGLVSRPRATTFDQARRRSGLGRFEPGRHSVCLAAQRHDGSKHGVCEEVFCGQAPVDPPRGDKRLIRRDDKGRIKESDDLGKSLSQDVRKAAKAVVKPGQGDRGDQKRKEKAK